MDLGLSVLEWLHLHLTVANPKILQAYFNAAALFPSKLDSNGLFKLNSNKSNKTSNSGVYFSKTNFMQSRTFFAIVPVR